MSWQDVFELDWSTFMNMDIQQLKKLFAMRRNGENQDPKKRVHLYLKDSTIDCLRATSSYLALSKKRDVSVSDAAEFIMEKGFRQVEIENRGKGT